jgi:cell division septal protein FtsQ
MKVKAATEKNFRRARVKPAARRSSLRTWVTWAAVRTLIVAVIVLYATYRAFDLVASASTLQVRRIVVHGNVRLSSGEVQALVDGLRGTNILAADLNAYRRKLLDSPWVSDVALRRVLPSTVEVFVSERQPMGLSRIGSQVYLVDRTGTVIDEYGPQYAEFDLPIIDGLVRPPSSGQPSIDERRADLAGRVIEALAPRHDLARRLSQIDVADLHDAVVLLDDDPALLHVGEERFLERLQSYVDVAEALRERVADIDYVDLRFGERLYVRPASAKGVGAASSASAKSSAFAKPPADKTTADKPAEKAPEKPARTPGKRARNTSGRHRRGR